MACGQYWTDVYYLNTGVEVLLDSICTVLKVVCDIGGHAIIQYVPCQITKNLQYNIILAMDWLKSTNPLIDWVVFFLDLTVSA